MTTPRTLTGHRDRLAALEEHARSRRDGVDGETKIIKEVIVERDDAAIKALEDQVLKLKAERTEPANDQEVIPAAIGDLHKEIHNVGNLFDEFRKQVAGQLADLHRRIQELEDRPIDITPTEPAELQDNLDGLNEKIADIAKAMLTDLLEHNQRIETLETRVQNMPRRLLELYQNELKSIA